MQPMMITMCYKSLKSPARWCRTHKYCNLCRGGTQGAIYCNLCRWGMELRTLLYGM